MTQHLKLNSVLPEILSMLSNQINPKDVSFALVYNEKMLMQEVHLFIHSITYNSKNWHSNTEQKE